MQPIRILLFTVCCLLFAATVHAATLKLTWQDNSNNELGFALERCQGAGCTGFKELTRTGVNVTEALDATVAEGVTYCYRVRAFNNDASGKEQFSDYTNTACGMAPVPIAPPNAPGNLQTANITTSSLDLRWQVDPGGAQTVAQQVEMNDHPQGRADRYRLLTAVKPELREWRVAGLSRNSSYHFRMRNCDALSRCSEYSNVASAKTGR